MRNPQSVAPTPAGGYTVLGVLPVLLRGIVALARAGQLWGSPRTVSLRLVDWYRTNVSAGQQRCPSGRRGRRASCSRYGQRMIERYGALLGWWLALARMRRCSLRTLDPDGEDAVCMDQLADCWCC